jgi:lipoate-protein ligase B
MARKSGILTIIDLGKTRYNIAYETQKKLVEMRYDKKIPDCLLVTEHHPVITAGRGTDMKNLLVSPEQLEEQSIDFAEIERGGDITFHGPGQIVFYPIIDLRQRRIDVRKYLRDLEQFTIKALSEFGLTAEIKEGLTGIWVNDYKIGAIGVAVSKWITFHGLALNIDTDLDYFKLINPCGITEYPVGNVMQFLKKPVSFKEIKDRLIKHYIKFFDYKAEIVNVEHLLNLN